MSSAPSPTPRPSRRKPRPLSAPPLPRNPATPRLSHDKDGNLRATLDAEGYLSEYIYDAAGRLRETIGYATATEATPRSNGTLEPLRPAASPADPHRHL